MSPLLSVLALVTPLGVASAALLSPTLEQAASSTLDELEPEALESLIEGLAKTIEDNYVFEDIAKQIGAKLRENMWEGRYEVKSLGHLAGLLTTDLRSVNNDLHLGVRVIPEDSPSRGEGDAEEARRQRLERARRSNYGFAKVEILEGNVGYLDLRGFSSPDIAGDTAVAAMAFLANSDAVIIDLRRNGGGDPSMVQLLTSYFFAEPTHLNSFQWRGEETITQFWTLPHVPGKKMVDVPLFVLTSARTFSAAEEFTYNLRNLERATIVGETTGGGAHPGGTHRVDGLLSVFIPGGRAINPISGTNWEGTGVEPHVAVPADKALDEALRQVRKLDNPQ